MNWHDLLGFNEQRMWKSIRENKKLFWEPNIPNYGKIREQWNELKRKFEIEE
jgi:hypothetical protein